MPSTSTHALPLHAAAPRHTAPPTAPVGEVSPLVAEDLVVIRGGRTILDGLDLRAAPGRVLGVIGENGSGKSTLLHVLAGELPPDAGTVRGPADVGLLTQELRVRPCATVADVLREAVGPLLEAVAALEALTAHLDDPAAAAEYDRVLAWAAAHNAWDAERRAGEAASRLGLGRLDPRRTVAGLSGGQRSRLALAALLARRPACLLLDEPTNHLDDDAAVFVEESLRRLPGVVVVASHDRQLLDVADEVLDLDPVHGGSDGRGGRLHGIGRGGYAAVVRARADERSRWAAAHEHHEAEKDRLRLEAERTRRTTGPRRAPRDGDRHLLEYRRARTERSVSRRVRDAERRLEVLEREPVPRPPRPLHLDTELTAVRGGEVAVRDLHLPGRVRVDHLDVAPGRHLLVTGPNGCGKSTLLTALAGRLGGLVPDGTVRVRAHRVGHLPQDVRFSRPDLSPEQVYARVRATTPLADLGLFHPRDLNRRLGQLSHGQQRRLALALVVARRPDLLLLDEPTNHLSLALADELEEAVGRARGTVVVASHDRWLRGRWAGETLALEPAGGATVEEPAP